MWRDRGCCELLYLYYAAFYARRIIIYYVIVQARNIPRIDEYIGEISFPHYWKDWPANFGTILQGVIMGPHSISPMFEEEFQFM
jgi:hypothetical protein